MYKKILTAILFTIIYTTSIKCGAWEYDISKFDKQSDLSVKHSLYDVTYSNSLSSDDFSNIEQHLYPYHITENFRNSFIKRANSEQQQRINALADAMHECSDKFDSCCTPSKKNGTTLKKIYLRNLKKYY